MPRTVSTAKRCTSYTIIASPLLPFDKYGSVGFALAFAFAITLHGHLVVVGRQGIAGAVT
jgi:hypothetical protein